MTVESVSETRGGEYRLGPASIRIDFYELGVVHICPKCLFNRLDIRAKAIGRELEAPVCGESLKESRHKEVSPFDALQLGPEPLARVQLRGIGWQALQVQPRRGASGQELLDELTAMNGGAIPEDDPPAGHFTSQARLIHWLIAPALTPRAVAIWRWDQPCCWRRQACSRRASCQLWGD